MRFLSAWLWMLCTFLLFSCAGQLNQYKSPDEAMISIERKLLCHDLPLFKPDNIQRELKALESSGLIQQSGDEPIHFAAKTELKVYGFKVTYVGVGHGDNFGPYARVAADMDSVAEVLKKGGVALAEKVGTYGRGYHSGSIGNWLIMVADIPKKQTKLEKEAVIQCVYMKPLP